jgi:hypothetical protein
MTEKILVIQNKQDLISLLSTSSNAGGHTQLQPGSNNLSVIAFARTKCQHKRLSALYMANATRTKPGIGSTSWCHLISAKPSAASQTALAGGQPDLGIGISCFAMTTKSSEPRAAMPRSSDADNKKTLARRGEGDETRGLTGEKALQSPEEVLVGGVLRAASAPPPPFSFSLPEVFSTRGSGRGRFRQIWAFFESSARFDLFPKIFKICPF